MRINLTPEQEKLVNEELKSGHFRTAEEVIDEALQALREKEQPSPVTVPNGEQRQAVREMLSFVEKNRVRLEGISVKELIHKDDDLTDEERRALHEALRASWQSAEAGRLRSASAILDELRKRR